MESETQQYHEPQWPHCVLLAASYIHEHTTLTALERASGRIHPAFLVVLTVDGVLQGAPVGHSLRWCTVVLRVQPLDCIQTAADGGEGRGDDAGTLADCCFAAGVGAQVKTDGGINLQAQQTYQMVLCSHWSVLVVQGTDYDKVAMLINTTAS